MTKIEIICKEAKLDKLKNAITKLGITGMTVSHVVGFGNQKGKPEYYRGVPVEINLMPKVQVDIVVSKIPVRRVVDTAKKALYTDPCYAKVETMLWDGGRCGGKGVNTII